MSDDGAVPFHARAHVNDGGMARVAGGELLGVLEDHSYGVAGGLGQVGQQRDVARLALATEISPDGRRVEQDPFDRRLDGG